MANAPDFSFESAARERGLLPVAGVDEAGRGPLAGPVTAAADGWVRWAGQVIGSGTVVIEHADGVRTTYNGLTEVWVNAGTSVLQGDGLGMAGTNVHFGALVRSTYLDPQLLIDASEGDGRSVILCSLHMFSSGGNFHFQRVGR